MKGVRYRLVRTRSIPTMLREGRLYVSKRYQTASHLCPCGCGNRVVTPLGPGQWAIQMGWFTATLHPSIGNWHLRCRSHYWIRANKVVWAGSMTEDQIERNWRSDRQDILEKYQEDTMAKQTHVVHNTKGGWDVKQAGAERVSAHRDTKADAVDRAREISRNQGTELKIHNKDGRFAGSDSHGDDPYPPKG